MIGSHTPLSGAHQGGLSGLHVVHFAAFVDHGTRRFGGICKGKGIAHGMHVARARIDQTTLIKW